MDDLSFCFLTFSAGLLCDLGCIVSLLCFNFPAFWERGEGGGGRRRLVRKLACLQSVTHWQSLFPRPGTYIHVYFCCCYLLIQLAVLQEFANKFRCQLRKRTFNEKNVFSQ